MSGESLNLHQFKPEQRIWIDLMREAHVGDVVTCLSIALALTGETSEAFQNASSALEMAGRCNSVSDEIVVICILSRASARR